MKKSALSNAVSFRYAILDTYSKIGLNENELSVCLMIDHLLEQGNYFITPDMLSLKMSLSSAEINDIIASLMKRGFVSYETKKKGLTISINGIQERVYSELLDSMNREKRNKYDEDKLEADRALYAFFEEKYGRTLSPLEQNTINDWLDGGYTDTEIRNALLDALGRNKKTIKEVNKILLNKRKQNDIQKEGASAVNDRWDKDIDETVKAAKLLWGDGE